MENGLAGPLLEMPALSETPGNAGNSENGTGTSTSELLCKINHPEDVGAVVTSFCKLSADGQIKEEVFEDGLFVQQPHKFNEFSQGISAHTSSVLTRPDLDQVDQEEADLDDEMELDEDEDEKFENGQNEIKEEMVANDNNETVENGNNGTENNDEPAALVQNAKPKDIIVSIKDENSQSSSEEEYEEEYNAQGDLKNILLYFCLNSKSNNRV